MTSGSALFRADASVAIGTGHVMRCLALAQAWQDAGGQALFAVADTTPAIQQRLEAESCDVALISASGGTPEDGVQLAGLAREHGAEWIVLDGYKFGAAYQRALKADGFKLLVVDDYGHSEHYYADLVLNQNAGAGEDLYREREPFTKLLLGPRFSLLRREFVRWREHAREIAETGSRVLVMMGGSDPLNLTAVVVGAISHIEREGLEVLVVVGGSNPYFDSLQQVAARSRKNIRLEKNVENIAERMAWADVAVSAAGSTCAELCVLALPALITDVADNQTAVAIELDRLECAVRLGSAQEVTASSIAKHLSLLLESRERRLRLSQNGRALVDGYGARRVLAAFRGERLWLRRAQAGDARLLWEWANDPDVREASFETGMIPWERHEAWFTSKMKDRDCQIWIAEDAEGSPVGQFRVDWHSEDGEVDVSLSHACRGAGYGRCLIEMAAHEIFAERPGARLHALVKAENQPSRRAFAAAGFRFVGEEQRQGQPTAHFVRVDTDRGSTGSRDVIASD